MEFTFAFVVRNLETDIDSDWIDLTTMTEEEAREEWYSVVDENFDWEIVDIECTFDIDYYKYQYAAFENLYEAYNILEYAAKEDSTALVAQAMLDEGKDIEDIYRLDDRPVIFAGSEHWELGEAAAELFGIDNVNLERYFDYESFGRDLRLDGFIAEIEEEDPEYAERLMDMTDTELGFHYVDDILGGIEELGQNTLERHFDYDQYGRDLSFDFTFVSIEDIEGWVSDN